jgi:hypothetical protein
MQSKTRLLWTLGGVVLIGDQMVQNQLGWGWFAGMFLIQMGFFEDERAKVTLTAVCILLAITLGGWRVIFG